MYCDSIYVLGRSSSSRRIGNATDQMKNPFNKRLYLNSSNIPHSTIESMTPLALLNTCLCAYTLPMNACVRSTHSLSHCVVCKYERASERHQRVSVRALLATIGIDVAAYGPKI